MNKKILVPALLSTLVLTACSSNKLDFNPKDPAIQHTNATTVNHPDYSGSPTEFRKEMVFPNFAVIKERAYKVDRKGSLNIGEARINEVLANHAKDTVLLNVSLDNNQNALIEYTYDKPQAKAMIKDQRQFTKYVLGPDTDGKPIPAVVVGVEAVKDATLKALVANDVRRQPLFTNESKYKTLFNIQQSLDTKYPGVFKVQRATLYSK